LVGIVIAGVGVTSAVQLLFAVWTLYFRGQSELRPRWRHCSLTAWNSLFTRGVDFLLLQLCSIAFFQIDAFLIAHFLTTNDVTPYSIAQKAFLQLSGLFAIVSGSMWGAYGDARASGDVVWIRRARQTIERIFLVFYGGLAVVMVLFGHSLLGWWVGDAAAPGTLLIAAVAAYFCAREWTTLHAMLLNGLDVIRPQVWVLSVTAVLILVLNTIAVQTLGVIGLALGGLIGFSCLSAWYLPLLASRALPRIQRESAASLTAWDRAPHVQSADAPTLG
jgi:O-antigen/teichoic acid export membrane protein